MACLGYPVPGCVSSRSKSATPMESVWVEDIISRVKTGDVLLTSNKDGGAKIIKFFTQTK